MLHKSSLLQMYAVRYNLIFSFELNGESMMILLWKILALITIFEKCYFVVQRRMNRIADGNDLKVQFYILFVICML